MRAPPLKPNALGRTRVVPAISHRSGVLVPLLPYDAWRALIDYLWGDHSFMYHITPRFVEGGFIQVILHDAGGPTSAETIKEESQR